MPSKTPPTRVVGLDLHPDIFTAAILQGTHARDAQLIALHHELDIGQLVEWATERIARIYLSGLAKAVWQTDETTRQHRELLGAHSWSQLQWALLEEYCAAVQHAEQRRHRLRELISIQVAQNGDMRNLMQLLGVSVIDAFALVASIGDITRFASPRKLVAYLGLAESRDRSGRSIDKKRGWLNDGVHFRFREFLTHTAFRYQLICPCYVLMPDHLHLIWIGYDGESSDQRVAMRYLRKQLDRVLWPIGFKLQKQGYDHGSSNLG